MKQGVGQHFSDFMQSQEVIFTCAHWMQAEFQLAEFLPGSQRTWSVLVLFIWFSDWDVLPP
jgi:hypothetical protein